MIGLPDIERAREALRDAIYLSPCARTEALSRTTGCEVYLKLENLQMTGSFKERGARNRLLALDASQRARGVIAASAGNHAQGVAFHARALGIAATIVMPCSTPLNKVVATRGFGAEVVLHGDGYDEAAGEARRLQADRQLVGIPAFDDDLVIAGQGTLGLEVLEQVEDLDAVVVPVGGGGLIGGVAAALKERKPSIGVYGVEAAAIAGMRAALEAGEPIELPAARTIADGIAVRCVSERTRALCERYVDDLVTVDEEELSRAVLMLIEQEKTVAEGAGAAALAALMQGSLPLSGKRVAVLVTGGNIDVNLVSRIIDRGLRRSGRTVGVKVLLRDVPGALVRMLEVVASHGANVLSVHHDRVTSPVAVGVTTVELTLETRGFEHVAEVEAGLRAAGYSLDGSMAQSGP